MGFTWHCKHLCQTRHVLTMKTLMNAGRGSVRLKKERLNARDRNLKNRMPLLTLRKRVHWTSSVCLQGCCLLYLNPSPSQAVYNDFRRKLWRYIYMRVIRSAWHTNQATKYHSTSLLVFEFWMMQLLPIVQESGDIYTNFTPLISQPHLKLHLRCCMLSLILCS